MTAFEGRGFVVSGGGGALGRAVVTRLLDAGAQVHVPAHGPRDVETLAPLRSERLHVESPVDLTDEAAVAQFYDGVDSLYASVHLAGGFVFGSLAEASVADFERMVAMNLRTCWLCCREAARRMEGPGRIVNVAAKPALVPTGDVVTYAATKSAVAGLTLALAEELAPRGIWVNAIAPSIMDTPSNRQSMPDADFEAWPKVDEVARAIVHLASPDNGVARGGIVPVYGRS